MGEVKAVVRFLLHTSNLRPTVSLTGITVIHQKTLRRTKFPPLVFLVITFFPHLIDDLFLLFLYHQVPVRRM